MDKTAEIIPIKRSKEVTEARKAERKKKALARRGISRWTFSDPDHDFAIMADIGDCIDELGDEQLIKTMKDAWLKASAEIFTRGIL